MSDAIHTVGQVTRAIKDQLEGTFPFIWVRGQVSNCTRPSSGHLYFSLKDEEAILNAVWFKGNQKESLTFDPLTGEVFEDGPRPSLAMSLENGQEIICAGELTVYPPRGTYQLVIEIAQDAGIGRSQLEFERIKALLLAKGYFDTARKRPLPINPGRVAVVTALSGAAIHDFLRIGESRGMGGEVCIYPALVQGNNAPEQIAKALSRIAEDGWAEVAVLIRGGGSLEDLWAFNTEIVADALFNVPIPILTGIGHEVDISIADMVADVRAATPTHAAQLLWTERREMIQRIDETETHLHRVWQTAASQREQSLATLSRALAWLSPSHTLARWEDRLTTLREHLERSMTSHQTRTGQIINDLERRFHHSVSAAHALQDRALERLSLYLNGLDPMRPLVRGYTLAQTSKGSFVRSVADVTAGDALTLILLDGSVPVRVESQTKKTGSTNG